MPCFQQNSQPDPSTGLANVGVGSFATEAECLEACKEGACCNGTTCTVKPQCQCDAAAGEVFKGVGTVCSPNPCVPCFEFCKPSKATPPETIYFTVSNYSAQSAFQNLGSIDGTYALQIDPGGCDNYGTLLYPTDCVGQPAYCFSPCTHKLAISVNSSFITMFAFDQTQQGSSSCQGFNFFRSGGFNSCTSTTASGVSGSMSSNQVGASFSWSIGTANPLP